MRYAITGLMLLLFIISSVHLHLFHICIETHNSLIQKKSFIVKSDDCGGEDTDHPIPIINGPTDIEYREGKTNNTLTWYIKNCSAQKFEIKRSNKSDSNQNHIFVEGGYLSHGNSTIIISIDGLSVGIYEFYLFIWGIYYTCIWSDMVTVTVITMDSSTTSTLPNDSISQIVLIGFSCVFIIVLLSLVVVSRKI